VGALSCIAYSDRIGRLRSILIGLVLAVIALAIESSAFRLSQFVVGRVLVGISIGVISTSIPVWQTECSTTKHRGAFVIMEGLFISTGITISEWASLGFFFAFSTSPQWRVTLVFPAVLAFFVMPFIVYMPESPRWLARKGRMEEARGVIAALMDKDMQSDEVRAEIAHIQLSLENTKGSLKLLVTNGKERYFHRTVLAAAGLAFQQMCGVSALVFYTSTIFGDLGFTGVKSRLLGCALVTLQSLTALIPLFTVDRVGRRKLLMLSAAGLSVSMAVVAGTGYSRLADVAAVFIFVFGFFFPIGFLGLPFLYASEIAPLRMRVPITAIAVATQWLCQFIVGQITPPGITNLSNRYYIIFAVLNASFVPIVYFFFPETNGRSLEEIDSIFEQSGTFSVVKTAAQMPRQIDHPDMEHIAEKSNGNSMQEVENISKQQPTLNVVQDV
jgi:sugar porter (SP) family MFS transporter